jgi:hypothetical protein
VGYLVNPEDMPFSSSGTVPDVIFNPFGMRRMTVSHLMESLGAKVGALNGRYIDGTPFSGEKTDDLRNELKELGFRENGTETLYDGRTGREYEAKIFVGNIYYLRLKHQVKDKVQSRARGRVALLTRQPTAGKAMEGGLRFGSNTRCVCFLVKLSSSIEINTDSSSKASISSTIPSSISFDQVNFPDLILSRCILVNNDFPSFTTIKGRLNRFLSN